MPSLSLPVRIVLVETSHPGNIGAVARAMKNMGLQQLHLVQPREFPHAEASARAVGADDVLANAVLHESLAAAVADCGLVIGTSARQRHIPFVPIEPRECAQLAVSTARAGDAVALVFGTERTGLTNPELALCGALVTIPTSDIYSSLNIAMAVQIIAYEVQLAARAVSIAIEPDEPLATQDEMEHFYQHLQSMLRDTSFRDYGNDGHLMSRVRRLFNRARATQHEVRILRGILSGLQSPRVVHQVADQAVDQVGKS
ncbi:MAG: RNA methyltransferase [Steroidobacteraceae bacterium]